MSVDQQQRALNRIDKEIADLQKKKAGFDKKMADEQKKASGVSISKNASASTVKSKMREIERHNDAANKASKDSADIQKKISDKTKQRNSIYIKLQSEQQREQKLKDKVQQQQLDDMQRIYEQRITELEGKALPTLTDVETDNKDQLYKYDVFVSHAFEDKEKFVNEFVQELQKLGVKVWYDDTEIRWGDSMRKQIDEGLKKSKYGIVVLSPNYIAEGKYWTKAELDGLFQLEGINGKRILPIWHNLTKQQVTDFSPIIAGRKAMTTAIMTTKEMAEELVKLLGDEENDENGKN